MRIGAVVKQPGDRFLVELASGRVKRRPAIRARRINQRRIRLQHFECAAALPIGDQEQFVRRRGRLPGVRLTPALFLFANDRNNIVVAALFGERQRGCGLAMRINPRAGVGAMPHQYARHPGRTAEDGVMERAALVLPRAHVGQLRPCTEHCLDRLHLSRADRLDQAFGGHPVHVSFQFRPALKPIGARQNQLGVMECE